LIPVSLLCQRSTNDVDHVFRGVRLFRTRGTFPREIRPDIRGLVTDRTTVNRLSPCRKEQ
jgi:hypothetical protein